MGNGCPAPLVSPSGVTNIYGYIEDQELQAMAPIREDNGVKERKDLWVENSQAV